MKMFMKFYDADFYVKWETIFQAPKESRTETMSLIVLEER